MFRRLLRYHSRRRWDSAKGSPNFQHFAYFTTSSTTLQINNGKPKNDNFIGKRISNMVVDFIKAESKAIGNALVNESPKYAEKYVFEDDIYRSQYAKLTSEVREDLESKVDNYNKLTALITYDPILVHPQIYITLHEMLEERLDRDLESILLKRLICHGRFEECWKILLNRETTLNDIDEQIEFLTGELEACNNLEFGVCDFLIAARQVITNNSILNTLIETTTYKFDLEKTLISGLLSRHQELQSIDTSENLLYFKNSNEEELSSNFYLRALYFRNWLRILSQEEFGDVNNNKVVKQFHKELFEEKEFTRVAGWLMFILKKSYVYDAFTITESFESTSVGSDKSRIFSLIPFTMLKHKKIRINQHEFLFCLQNSTNEKVYECYEIYKRILRRTRNKPNTYIANRLVKLAKDIKDIDRLYTMSSELFPFIDSDLIVSTMLEFHVHSKAHFSLFLKSLDNNKKINRTKIYKTFIDRAMSELFLKDDLHATWNLLDDFYNSDLSSSVLLTVLSHIRKNESLEDDKYDFFHKLVTKKDYTSFALIEIFRCLIRNKQTDFDELQCKLLQNLIVKLLNKEKTFSRIPSLEWDPNKDFELLFKYANYYERSRFHNRIRALAQSISQLDVDEIVRLLNLYHSFICSDDFIHIRSETGRLYIFNCLVADVVRFLERSSNDDPRECLFKLRRLAQNLGIKSEIIQGSMYKLMVKEDSNKALEFIRFHTDNNSQLTKSSIRYIILGIFKNNKIPPAKRFSIFKALNEELEKNEYKISYDKHTIIEMIKVLVLIYESDPQNSPVSATWIINYAFSKKVPRKIILHWIKKLKPSQYQIKS